MKTLKKLLAAAMLLGASVGANASVSAHVNDYNLGQLSVGYNGFGANFVSGSFLDNLHFTLSSPSEGGFGVGALNFTVGGMPMLNINNLTMSLLDNNSNNLGSGLDFTVNALNAGNYYLQVSGNANGVGGGVYAGGINLSPVPEPSLWSSLVAGLAVIGFMAYRRRTMY